MKYKYNNSSWSVMGGKGTVCESAMDHLKQAVSTDEQQQCKHHVREALQLLERVREEETV
jgi:hypothetical protein